jgi:hypothetical protein
VCVVVEAAREFVRLNEGPDVCHDELIHRGEAAYEALKAALAAYDGGRCRMPEQQTYWVVLQLTLWSSLEASLGAVRLPVSSSGLGGAVGYLPVFATEAEAAAYAPGAQFARVAMVKGGGSDV